MGLSKAAARRVGAALLACGLVAGGAAARAAPGREPVTIRVGLQAGGTFAWVVHVVQTLGLDQAHGVRVKATTYATKQGAEVAFRAGEVDVVLDDFVGVAALRQRGVAARAIYPFSLAAGGVVVPAGSSIRGIADLQGKRIAVASLDDKSWLVLRALSVARHGVDLQRAARVQAAAPPLMLELLRRGELDAALPYWHFVARLEGSGEYRVVLSVSDMLADLGLPTDLPILFLVTHDNFLQANRAALEAFLGAVQDAWQRLEAEPALWDQILARNLYRLPDPSLLPAVREHFLASLPRRWDKESVRGLGRLVATLVEVAGPEVVGVSRLDPAAFTTELVPR